MMTQLSFAQSTSCYQCTSNEKPDCESSDVAKLAPFKKNCPPLTDGQYKGKPSIGCRKILQSIEGENSVVRECAYAGNKVDGLKKTGNWAVHLHYYQCENTKPSEPCNGASSIFVAPVLIFTSLIMTIFWQ
ncbi:hypothetical protein WR25_14392 [Diploscapter pachys]|uniref:Protein quiver n=1 Tax=Diploscapter pachys TaxID=2018661 RepID=A0A2A2LI01_9BILA|nr:hypothetical protein WR25_14392 [Diploscapter pachys]